MVRGVMDERMREIESLRARVVELEDDVRRRLRDCDRISGYRDEWKARAEQAELERDEARERLARTEEAQRQDNKARLKMQRKWEGLCRDRDKLRRLLGDLLARIHRDGGHPQEGVGEEQAVRDAHDVVRDLFTRKWTIG